MSLIPVTGMDPSLNNWGLAHGHYNTATREITVHTVDVIQPDIPGGKQVRQNSKDLERARQLAFKAALACQGSRAIFVEVPVGSQSARAMASYGICVGVLGSLMAQDMPFFEVTPTELKLATVGSKTASKNDMIRWAMTHFPSANWPMQTKDGRQVPIASKAEHMADACGAIDAGTQLKQFQQILSLIKAA
jgi:Holliday junction resolvasome RuvABC endonuclease subunit